MALVTKKNLRNFCSFCLGTFLIISLMLLSIGCGATPVAEPPPQEVNILDLTIDPSKVSPSETFYLEARTLGPAKSAKVNLKKANKVVASYQLNLETGNPTSIQIWTKVENRPPDEKGRYQAEVVATHLFEGKTKKAKKSLKKWILVVK